MTETDKPLGLTDRQMGVGGVGWVGAVKPGQQRTRVMLSHSSHIARLVPGKDRGRRVQEQGRRGEAKWGRNWAGWGFMVGGG